MALRTHQKEGGSTGVRTSRAWTPACSPWSPSIYSSWMQMPIASLNDGQPVPDSHLSDAWNSAWPQQPDVHHQENNEDEDAGVDAVAPILRVFRSAGRVHRPILRWGANLREQPALCRVAAHPWLQWAFGVGGPWWAPTAGLRPCTQVL